MNSIAHAIGRLPEVTNVDIDLEQATVTISTTAENNRALYEETLANAGYPPIGAANPFYRKATSYVSCAIGRVSTKA